MKRNNNTTEVPTNDEEGLKAIRDVLGLPKSSQDDHEDKELKEIFRKSIEAINRTFTVGECYIIAEGKQELNNPSWDTPILRYEGKRGIHHVFREVVGNWLVTYTNAQLVGKHIRQVKQASQPERKE